jgi:NADPH:quinone reductase-like Zn-dependent oxidoreductase
MIKDTYNPEIMKAIVLKGFGGVENLVKINITIPDISDNEVLVKVKAISINPVDIKTRTGKALAGRLKDFNPIILGWDISGIITETGSHAKVFKKGDEVFGMVNFPGHGKAYAEYVAAPESDLTLKPTNLSHQHAAAASLAALTAWQILKEKIQIKTGDKILIHAAAGGVGHYAIQMSKYFGAYVIGTASGKNRDFILSIGASEFIDYEKQIFEDIVHDIDFVIDTIGGDYIDRSIKVLKPGGTIISIPSGVSENVVEKAKVNGMNGYTFSVKSNGRNMNEISDLLQKNIIKSYISSIFTFDEIQSAHLQIETRKTKGKVVVTLE